MRLQQTLQDIFLFSYKSVVFIQTQFMNPEMLERLVRVQMPYGKYKGRVIADLPGNYLNWFAREGFPKGRSASCWH